MDSTPERFRFDVFLIDLPTVDQLEAAHDRDPTSGRKLVMVKATGEDGRIGWGECSALNAATYTPEWAAGAFDLLTARATDLSELLIDPGATPMASASIDMALTDLLLIRAESSLASSLGATNTHVPAGAVVGLGMPRDVMAKAENLVDAGYRRLKLKIVPGELQIVREVREAFPDIEIQVDGNGSFGQHDVEKLAELADEADLDAIEQPFAPDDIDAAADLVELTSIPVMADEAVDSLADAKELFEFGALSGVVIKPPKLGGFEPALDLVDWTTTNGLAACVGGMLESGLGRHALAAMAAVDGFSVTGDLSPARRWLADDPWSDLTMTDGWIEVPSAIGVAPHPDPDVLERYSVRQSSVEAEISAAI